MDYPPSSPSDQHLAQVGRQRFAEGLVSGLPEITKALQAFVADLTNQIGTLKEMQERREIWFRFNEHQRDWAQRVQSAWTEGGKAVDGAVKPAQSTASQELSLEGGFELLSDDVVENKILASRIALTVSEKSGNQFEIARLRTQRLLGYELSKQDLLRPENVCQHIVDAWGDSGMQRSDLQLMLEPLQRSLAELLEKQYQTLNKLYEERGVSATTEFRARVRRTAPPGAAPGGPTSGNMGVSSGFDSGPAPMGQFGQPGQPYYPGQGSAFGGMHPGQQVAASGYYGHPNQAHGQGQGPAMAPPSAWANTTPMQAQAAAQLAAAQQMQMSGAQMPFMVPLLRARQRAQQVMVQLRNLLTQPVMGYDMVNAPPASAALVQALTDYRMPAADTLLLTAPGMVPDYSPQAVVQVMGAVRERAAEFKKKASSASEKAIIEVVALMFQSILSEDRLPSSIRVWFARLQVPVLRVALAEPDFFSNMTHPARQLIDRMGSCVLGFDASTINGTALEAEVRRIVQVIEQYPETGSRVFQLVHDEFERFIAKSLAEIKGTQKIVSVAQQVEQKETLAVQYTIELRDMLKDIQVRDEIRDFLFKTWAEVLAVSAVRNGAQHDETRALKRAATDLVWAASAKPHRAERAQVIQNLPALLQNLRAGLAMIGVLDAAQDAQIKVLTDTLADAFLSKTAAIPREQIEAMVRRLANLEDVIGDTAQGDFALSAENVEMLLGIDASSIHVIPDNDSPVRDEVVAWARQMPVGAWFTIDHNGTTTQVQYAWHSQRKQLHLFAAMDGSSYLIQLRRLGAYLQSGLLVAKEEEALTMRATRDALAKLDANPERLLG